MDFLRYLATVRLRAGRHVGVDVGGANLKFCQVQVEGQGVEVLGTRSVPFPLWKQPEDLADRLMDLLPPGDLATTVSITMTGEIADCFATKKEGVQHIVRSCQQACSQGNLRFFRQHQRDWFVNETEAVAEYLTVAASNWYAVARLLGPGLQTRQGGSGLILDLGSTTFDLTPIGGDSRIETATDWERLCQGGLVYTGVGRSPLACLLPSLEFEGRPVWLAQELFATARDVYLLSGQLPEDAQCCNTADGRPALRQNAGQRIARMFCSDLSELPDGWLERVVDEAVANHSLLLRQAISQQNLKAGPADWVLMMGQGEPILAAACRKAVPEAKPYQLSQCLSAELSEVAPAFAVAALRAMVADSDSVPNGWC